MDGTQSIASKQVASAEGTDDRRAGPTPTTPSLHPFSTGNVSEPRPYVAPNPPAPRPASEPMEALRGAAVAGPTPSSPKQAGASRSTSAAHKATPLLSPKKNPAPIMPADPQSASMVFDCQFRPDDEPYDDIHRIIDPLTRVAIGACGVSSAGRLTGKIAGCYSFILWLQDYTSDDQVACVGLVSRWAESTRGPELREWAQRERLQRVVVVSSGDRIVLETAGLRANANVISFDYLDGPSIPRYGCFRSLHIRFHVMSLR